MINSYQIDKKLDPILRQMEKDGVKLDAEHLSHLSQKAGLELLKLESEIQESLGRKFNLNSPSQLADVLYTKLKIEPAKHGIRRRKKHYSTGAQDLNKIRKVHPVVDNILKYRELAKLKNTYLDPLPKLIGNDDRLHTHYAVDTATGRLSSKNPNLQNIPAKSDFGTEIRKAFVAEKGHKLLIADYSQIELRIAAYFSQDPVMIEIFRKGEDIHHATAEELGVARKTAKAVNFGILYGVTAYGLGEMLEIPPEEAQILIDKYFARYQCLQRYINKITIETMRRGYALTLFGRKRYIPELRSPIERVRRFGQRIAVNTPIQGTAAEIIKLAMIAINSKLQTLNPKQIQSPKSKFQNQLTNQPINKSTAKVKLLLQVHDELVFEVSENRIKETAANVKEIMESVVQLKIPLVVNLSVGKNWEESEELRA